MNEGPIRFPAVVLVFAGLTAASLTVTGGEEVAAETRKSMTHFLKVDGLHHGMVLWIRAGPGKQYRRVGLLRFNARAIRSYGCKTLASGYWCEISYRGTRGWSSGRYLADDHSRRT